MPNCCNGVVCRPFHVGAPFVPTQGLHFQALHPLSFYFIHTLHWCKHCTGLEADPNFRRCPFTALCRIAADGVVCTPVLVRAPFAPTQSLHFQALHLFSFLFICTLHWCKHCTRLEADPNFRKFSFTALCRIAADGVVYGPVLVGAPFAPTQDQHFQALHPLTFLFICTLHWCKHCSQLEADPDFSKFPFTALC